MNVTSRQIHSPLEKAKSERVPRQPTRRSKPRPPKNLPADVQQSILDSNRSGRTMKELATEFKVHRTTIRAALDRHTVTPRVHAITKAQVALAAQLYESGLSLARVGERIGFNAQTVATHLKRSGVTLREPHGRPQ